MVEALTVVGIVLIWAGLAISIWQSYQLLRYIFPRLPEARLAFISQTTLKIWVFAYTGWVLSAYLWGPWELPTRRRVNLLLVAALLAQVAWTAWAYNRWRPTRRRDTPRAGGIPDELDVAEIARRRAQEDAARGGHDDD